MKRNGKLLVRLPFFVLPMLDHDFFLFGLDIYIAFAFEKTK